MRTKEKETKRNIILWIIYGVMLAGTIVAFCFHAQIYGVSDGVDAEGNVIWITRSVFDQTFSTNVVLQWIVSVGVRALIHTVQIVTVAIALAIVLHFAAKITFRSKKGMTISQLVLNFLKWVIGIAAFFFILDAWGANSMTLLASAGVLTLLIGLGSQALVADILAGVFIVFEGDFQVGDIVIIDDWRGEVQSIGIRTTKLMDAGGNIKIINNSEIKTIINQTKELSIAKCYVGIEYGIRIEAVEAVIADHLSEIKEAIPAIVEGPFYKGVAELGESSVNLLFLAKCKEDDIYQVQRDLNRQIKIMFDDNGINIPFSQVVVTMAKEGDDTSKVSKHVEKKAETFAAEQKELSKGVEDKPE